jgi:hypothetical protein
MSVGGGAASLAGVWLRRLFLDPSTGELAAMDSKARRFRHIDHVVPAAEGGGTSVENGEGLCENCNYVKESPGWERHVVGADEAGGPGLRGDILTVTPTCHEYYSPPVALPGSDAGRERQVPRAGCLILPLTGRAMGTPAPSAPSSMQRRDPRHRESRSAGPESITQGHSRAHWRARRLERRAT